MNAKESVDQILRCLGGTQNIVTVTNCMTRLRVETKDETVVDENGLKEITDVLGLVHDRPCYYEVVVGPGKSRKYADICHEMGLPAAAGQEEAEAGADWKQNKENLKSGQKESKLKSALKIIGDIFVPLIPGVIAAGLCAGIASLISQLVPNYTEMPVWNLIYTLVSLINISFMTYITAWVGYRSAERFGATPILGGMLGLITSLDGINTIAQILGLYNESQPLQSILKTGKGGVLAVIIGVLVLSVVEKKVRKHMPDSVDIVFTPLLSLLIVAVPYILIIMPAFGYVSSAIVWVFQVACMSESAIIRIITGFAASALFLPLVAAGMHHGMVALYSVQLQEFGFITLYPALAMAGAGQVGASIAIMRKAKKNNCQKLVSVIKGALPAGFLGVGEPLIYGVTLPLGKPFVTAGIGAGFGGAFAMLMQVASTTWGPSGLLGVFVMTAGPKGPIVSIVCYLIGLVISYIMSYIITNALVKDSDVQVHPAGATSAAAQPSRTAPVAAQTSAQPAPAQPEMQPVATQSAADKSVAAGSQIKVKHGDPVHLGASKQSESVKHGDAINIGAPKQAESVKNEEPISTESSGQTEFTHTIKDPLGIHARPAGKIVQIIKQYDCKFTVEANGHTADGASVIELMSLGAVCGTELKCKAEGSAAKAAVKEVKEFMENNL